MKKFSKQKRAAKIVLGLIAAIAGILYGNRMRGTMSIDF